MKSKVYIFSTEWGFRTTRYGYRIHCNRFGKPPKKVKNKFCRKFMKCNFQWLIKFKFLNRRIKDSVKITHIFPHHTNTCTPSKDQLVMVRTVAEDYGKFTSLLLKDLIKLIDLNHFVNSRSIRELLQRALPNRKYISADDICNARVGAKMLIKQIKENDHSINTFQCYEDEALGLLRGLDDEIEDNIEKAMQCLKEIFQVSLYDQKQF